jgi:3-phenylpropionate/trans-cinnamate dioxygenase ferredoxin subunit
VAVARTAGSFFAFADTCTHEECSLSDGILTDAEVDCPCHGSVFDIRTGEALVGPALESVRIYALRVEDGRIQVSER